jgi:hypothetical protein
MGGGIPNFAQWQLISTDRRLSCRIPLCEPTPASPPVASSAPPTVIASVRRVPVFAFGVRSTLHNGQRNWLEQTGWIHSDRRALFAMRQSALSVSESALSNALRPPYLRWRNRLAPEIPFLIRRVLKVSPHAPESPRWSRPSVSSHLSHRQPFADVAVAPDRQGKGHLDQTQLQEKTRQLH